MVSRETPQEAPPAAPAAFQAQPAPQAAAAPVPTNLTHTQPAAEPQQSSGEPARPAVSRKAPQAAFQAQPALQASAAPGPTNLTHTQPAAEPQQSGGEPARPVVSREAPQAAYPAAPTAFQAQPAPQTSAAPTPTTLAYTQLVAEPQQSGGEPARPVVSREASQAAPQAAPTAFQAQPAPQTAAAPRPTTLAYTQPAAEPPPFGQEGRPAPTGSLHSPSGKRPMTVARDPRIAVKGSRAAASGGIPAPKQRQTPFAGNVRMGPVQRAGLPPLQELTYAPPAGAAQGAQPPVPPPGSGPAAASELQKLPGWAREFLQESFAHPQPGSGQPGAAPPRQPGGTAAGAAPRPSGLPVKAAAPGQEAQTVWTAPGYVGAPVKMAHKEKPQQQELPPLRVTDAEIRRVAGKVYQLIEDRMKRDRRRMGL